MGDTPGLLKREIVHQDDIVIVYRETWDLKVAGCPVVVMRPGPMGLELDPTATTLTREYFKRRTDA